MADVSNRLGVSTHSLYKWLRERQMPLAARTQHLSQSDELRRLKAELKRVTEERDILKSGGVLRAAVPLKYAFIAQHKLL